MSIYILITPRITISKILENALATSNISTSCYWHRTVQYIKSFPKKQELQKTTSRTFHLNILASVLNSILSYIKNLHSYLLSFTKRTQPLVDVEVRQREAEAEFDSKWEAGEIKGWEEATAKLQPNNGTAGGIWCSACMYFCSPDFFRSCLS